MRTTQNYLLAALLALTAFAIVAPTSASIAAEPEKRDYFVPGLAPVRAGRNYDVTIVYFMDYQCPACRKFTPDVLSVLDHDRRLRVIYRDTPIFGPNSERAARLAIASQFQGRHEAFHRALMRQKLPLDNVGIKQAAAVAGVNLPRLLRDLAARRVAIDRQIALNERLSQAAGISGTPAFIIGDTLANGALDRDALAGSIADARKPHGD